MKPLDLLRELDLLLTKAMRQGLGKKGLEPPPEWRDIGADGEIGAMAQRLGRFFDLISEAYRYADSLANGDLEKEVSRTNPFAMPLKALSASLRHLTWQTQQIAAGDLNQQVHFLGDFSASFNHMIEALRDKQIIEQRLQIITDVIGEGVCLIDGEGCLTFMNPEAQKLLGYAPGDCFGVTFHQLVHGSHPEGSLDPHGDCPLAQAISKGREYRDDDAFFTCKSGLTLPVSVVCRPILGADKPVGAVIAFHDISERKRYQDSIRRMNELLKKQAETDPLTGVYNRLKLSSLLALEMERARRYHLQVSVVLFDIDYFKRINDRCGHLLGDEVLKAVARLVLENIRCNEFLARWGGEEFLLVVPECGCAEAVRLAEKLRDLIAGHEFPVPDQVTASFGVAVWAENDTEATLTGRADKALYSAKHHGRNRVECC